MFIKTKAGLSRILNTKNDNILGFMRRIEKREIQ